MINLPNLKYLFLSSNVTIVIGKNFVSFEDKYFLSILNCFACIVSPD